ncbi:MAG: FHA domain-containing protein [Phototrophicaceae bacterium]
MAYGRLEVYFPDGRLETYLLHDDTVSIGRAEGNTVALDTDTISRYHFSIVHQDNTATITDLESVNGTFVDGMQLASNTPHLLGDVEEIMVGSLRIIYRQVDDSPTVMVDTIDYETQKLEIGDAAVRVEVDYRELLVWPAASSSAELAITNLGDTTREFSIQVSGLPTGWLRLTRPELQLDPNETAYVLLNVKPPRRPNTVPQHYQVTIEVIPADQPTLPVYAYMDVEIKTYSGFGMAIGQQADVNEAVPVFLHNQGSGTMRFTVTAKDPNNELTFQGPRAPLDLKAGQRLRIDLHVDAKTPILVGDNRTYKFQVLVQSHDASRFIAASDAKATLGARFPIWGAIAAAGITLSILIIGLLALLGVLNRPEPMINMLTISNDQVAQGEPLTIEIDANRMDTFDVLLNQSVIASDVSGDISSYTIATDDVAGTAEVTVIARNGSRSARETVISYVYVPIAMNRFDVSPNPLIRNSVNTISLSWDIAGAVLVRISGLSDFTNNLIQSSTEYSAVDTLEGIGGIPTQPLELTLYAEDEAGTAIEETLIVPLIDPQCTALIDAELREGPDARYPQIATVPTGSTLVVLAQDAGAGWLRFQLPQDLRVWGIRSDFDCAENFDISDLRTEVDVPELPSVSPTLIPTLTPAVAPTLVPTAQATTSN